MISIVLPQYGQWFLTHRFLDQLRHKTSVIEKNCEIILVDDFSPNRDEIKPNLAWWKGIFPNLKVIWLDKNLGFGGACNRGILEAKYDKILLTQNDVSIKSDFVHLMDKVIEHTLYGVELVDWESGWNKFEGQIVPYLAGWCLAFTKDTWDSIGGFDRHFAPFDYEDMDLSFRALLRGIALKKLQFPFVHQVGGTIGEKIGWSERKQVTLVNQRKFQKKWGVMLRSQEGQDALSFYFNRR